MSKLDLSIVQAVISAIVMIILGALARKIGKIDKVSESVNEIKTMLFGHDGHGGIQQEIEHCGETLTHHSERLARIETSLEALPCRGPAPSAVSRPEDCPKT